MSDIFLLKVVKTKNRSFSHIPTGAKIVKFHGKVARDFFFILTRNKAKTDKISHESARRLCPLFVK